MVQTFWWKFVFFFEWWKYYGNFIDEVLIFFPKENQWNTELAMDQITRDDQSFRLFNSYLWVRRSLANPCLKHFKLQAYLGTLGSRTWDVQAVTKWTLGGLYWWSLLNSDFFLQKKDLYGLVDQSSEYIGPRWTNNPLNRGGNWGGVWV